jgi:hypothetical protein
MPASVFSRVLRHQRGGGMCLTRECGLTMEASEEHRDASAGCLQVVVFLS